MPVIVGEQAGVEPCLDFQVAHMVDAAEQLPGQLYVVKAQIHAGGRGKGKFKELGTDAKGGVRLAKTLDEVRANAADMLGNTLVTIQTGEHGKQVNRLYITDGADIEKEFYLALLVDRATSRVAVVASTEGGMNIEEVAEKTPELIFRERFDDRAEHCEEAECSKRRCPLPRVDLQVEASL